MQRRDWWAAGVAAGVLVAVGAFVASSGAASIGAQDDGVRKQAAEEQTIQIRSRLPGTNAILFLVEDGAQVKKGDLLVELDDSGLRDELMRRKIEAEKAKSTLAMVLRWREMHQQRFAAMVSADSVKIAEMRLEQARAQLQVEQLSVEGEVKLAAHTQNLALSRHERLAELAQNGQVSQEEVEVARLEALKAEVALEQAQAARRLLVEFTKPLREAELELEIAQARAEQEAQRQEAEMALVQSDAERHAAEAAHEMAAATLRRVEEHITKSKIHAPRAGTVRHYRADDRPETLIRQGAVVRQRQVLLLLEPDAKKEGEQQDDGR